MDVALESIMASDLACEKRRSTKFNPKKDIQFL